MAVCRRRGGSSLAVIATWTAAEIAVHRSSCAEESVAGAFLLGDRGKSRSNEVPVAGRVLDEGRRDDDDDSALLDCVTGIVSSDLRTCRSLTCPPSRSPTLRCSSQKLPGVEKN